MGVNLPPTLRRLLGIPVARVGLALMALVLATALLGPWLVGRDAWDLAGPPLLWPGQDGRFPLGTDSLGRDLAAGLAGGAAVSLAIGIVSALIAALLGTLIGAVGGYYGGAVEHLFGRVTDLFQTVPPFILAVVTVAALPPSLTSVVVAIGAVSWPATARLVRTRFLVLRESEFVLAGRMIGMGDIRLITTQILPSVLPPIIVLTPLTVGTAIQTEAALGFLGLSPPDLLTWGKMIGEGREQLLDAWYICGLPGLAIMTTVLAFNLLGESLNRLMAAGAREGR
ncbi:ABC transporter permease [Nitrospirillum iridis]|uniref:Peptide/nickel transport system permease protein n=1 Tax=Nitrospirillum iridis TaxID=765888 RepID=A0A7X0EHN4_9PROT|nr:ABC transporter permease [Nitrospirillum iridis]MBB6255316.1 peptide/nickel transport system permease protein [Nitrospirillum iridis]